MTDLCSLTEGNPNSWYIYYNVKRRDSQSKKLDFSFGNLAVILFQTNLLPDGFLKFSREVVCDMMASYNAYFPSSFSSRRVSHTRYVKRFISTKQLFMYCGVLAIEQKTLLF